MFHFSSVRHPIQFTNNSDEHNINLLLTSTFDPIMTVPPLQYAGDTAQHVWPIQEQPQGYDQSMYCEREAMLDLLFGADAFHIEQPATRGTKKRRSSSNARIGYCQHPKHLDYREEKNPTMMPPTPRRGRPPKGTKAIDKKTAREGHVWAMTVRPLPKRLEKVVGQSNIKVCLTCLKRSDLDHEYLVHPAYIGPQPQQRKS